MIFNEAINLDEAVLDGSNRTLNNVILIRAGESANKRDYPAAVLRNAAPIFEGVKAYADHPTAANAKNPRSILDLTGWYKNVRFDESTQSLRADRVFAGTQAGRDAQAIAEDILSGRAPKNGAGLSINAVGTGKAKDGGGVIVEAITYAHSVDDVSTPAAGGAYVESQDELAAAIISAMTYEEFREAHPDYLARLKKEWQTVRLEESTKTALAEADERVKAAEMESGRLTEALAALQAEKAAAETAKETALSEMNTARRELEIERALGRVNLPAAWESSLRAMLLESEPGEWDAIISSEQAKAKAAGHRVSVRGAGQQIAEGGNMVEAQPVTPLPEENFEMWQQRMKQRK